MNPLIDILNESRTLFILGSILVEPDRIEEGSERERHMRKLSDLELVRMENGVASITM